MECCDTRRSRTRSKLVPRRRFDGKHNFETLGKREHGKLERLDLGAETGLVRSWIEYRLGGGFGGLYAAKALGHAPVDVTLVDRRNFHLFQPLLYQVATGSLSPGEIAAPLRALLRKQSNTRVLLGEASDLDVPNRRVILKD